MSIVFFHLTLIVFLDRYFIMITLRPYQQQLSEAIDREWEAGAQNICAVLPTGAGKTILFSNKLAQIPGIKFAIAHRQELISQMSMALAKFGIQHDIQGPASLIRWVIKLHMSVYGRHFYKPEADCVLISVQTLLKRIDSLNNNIRHANLWIIDECFPAGTIVDGKPIEELKNGNKISSYNTATGKIEKQTITHIFKNKSPKSMVRLDIKGHHAIHCTKNHPFWTKRGWIPAIQLTNKDEVLYYGSKNSKKRSSLYNLRKTNSYYGLGINKIQKNWQSLLLKNMLGKVSIKNSIRNNGKNEQKICFGTDEKKQSNETERSSEKSIGYSKTYRTSTKIKRWKWKAAYRSRENAISNISWFGFRITNCRKNRTSRGRFWVPSLLQNRLCKSKFKNRDRSGWAGSFKYSKANARQKEGKFFNWKRVENITIQKRNNNEKYPSCCKDGFVYNIEVSGTNTYFANGIVVHNCHHITRDNIWGRAVSLFPKTCRGLGVTATPLRTDGKGLGRHADGVFDSLVVGPGMRDLINAGYLSDYRIFAPQTQIDLSDVTIGSTGDYSKPKLTTAVRNSQIVGDVVEQYLRIAPGKLGVTFVTDIKTGQETVDNFRANGVPSELVHAKTADRIRREATNALKRGDLKNLVNVDIFGEGYDLPALEVCSFARPTQSYMLYVQQFGRNLRIMKGKQYGIIIDHVGNVMRHGLPDAYWRWSLDAREKNSRNSNETKVPPVRICRKCTGVYEPHYKICPYCGDTYRPNGRGSIEQIEGDLTEINPEILRQLRGERDRIDASANGIGSKLKYAGASPIAVAGAMKNHKERQKAQVELREVITAWAAARRAVGIPDYINYRDFYSKFGVDVMGAQILGKRKALELKEAVENDRSKSTTRN